VAVIHRKNDNGDKLVVIPEEKDDVPNEEIEKLVHFQEKYFDYEIIRH
jgi:inorganic pyrophosphatase